MTSNQPIQIIHRHAKKGLVLEPRSHELLADILSRTLETIEGIHKGRYRADHNADLARLNALEKSNLLYLIRDDEDYRIHPASLPLIDDVNAKALLSDMEAIFQHLQECYKANLSQPVPLAELAASLELPLGRIIECTSYVRKLPNLGAGTTNLQQESANIVPTEPLLSYSNIQEIIEQRLESWFPKELFNSQAKKPRNDGQANQIKVLEAALWVINLFPEQCRAESGRIKGAEVARIIDQKSALLFPNDGGDPPVVVEKMARIINKGLNLV